MESVYYIYRACGLLWTLALFVSFSFPLVWHVGAFGNRCTRPVFLCLSFAPLLVGALGSVEGFVTIMRAIGASTQWQPVPAQVDEGTRMALMTIWVGLAATASLLLIAAGGRLFPRDAGTKRNAKPSNEGLQGST